MTVEGRIHSYETLGTVDGPGIRMVIFLQGCPMKCKYCQNPDTWKMSEGEIVTSDFIIDEVKKYKSYYRSSGGGVTLSGGEPLLQPDFTTDILKKCKDEGIHTAIDTSGFAKIDLIKRAIELTDLILLDIKCIDSIEHKNLTGVDLGPVLKFAEYLSSIKKKTWIRHVLVPGITDDETFLNELAKYIVSLNNVERVEILPFHKIGQFKWKELGYEFELENTEQPTSEEIQKAQDIFRKYNLEVY